MRLKNPLKKGHEAERFAKAYLLKQGLTWCCSNYRCRLGEIDLVMQAACGTLVFVEVRARTSDAFGGALASVTETKQRKLIKTASYYLMKHPSAGKNGVRFDVLALDGKPPRVTWVKQAFEE